MTNIVKFPTARPSSDDDLEGLFDDPPDDRTAAAATFVRSGNDRRRGQSRVYRLARGCEGDCVGLHAAIRWILPMKRRRRSHWR